MCGKLIALEVNETLQRLPASHGYLDHGGDLGRKGAVWWSGMMDFLMPTAHKHTLARARMHTHMHRNAHAHSYSVSLSLDHSLSLHLFLYHILSPEEKTQSRSWCLDKIIKAFWSEENVMPFLFRHFSYVNCYIVISWPVRGCVHFDAGITSALASVFDFPNVQMWLLSSQHLPILFMHVCVCDGNTISLC